MKRSMLFAILVLIIVVSTVDAGAPTYNAYLYPVIARNPGAGGSFWATEVCSTNIHHAETLTVYFLFMQQGNVQFFIEDIPPEKTLCYSDIVNEALGLDRWQGAMIVTADPNLTYDWTTFRLVTRVKVYNTTEGGTFGLNVAPEIDHFGIGEPIHFYFSDGSDDDFFFGGASGVDNWGTVGVDGFRTNVGYFNAGLNTDTGEFDVWQDVVFQVYDRQGNVLHQESRTVAPLKQKQFAIPSSVVIRGGSVQLYVLGDADDEWGAPGRDFYGYFSVTDNMSGDGVYTPLQFPYEGDWDSYKKSGVEHGSYLRTLATRLLEKGTEVRRPTRRTAPK